MLWWIFCFFFVEQKTSYEVRISDWSSDVCSSVLHGVFPHFLHGGTGATIPFSPKDDGGDLVETSFLVAGLLCARQYFAGEAGLREAIDRLWQAVDWSWQPRDGPAVLYWHWSPRHDWAADPPARRRVG